MKTIISTFSIIAFFVSVCSFSEGTLAKKDYVYHVARLKGPIKIDANWDKPQWQNVQAVDISNFMGDIPAFKPVAQAKMMYSNENLYVIFHVQDRYVRCITKEFFGPVWEDAAVEFFFAPDQDHPELYFNLEINCGGTPLMNYNLVPRKESRKVELNDLKQVEIAHTLPQFIDPEIKEPVTWTLEYRIPLSILQKYSHVSAPGKGVQWRANFYKIAENNSNHHYITWSFVDNEKPDFHLPRFFGKLIFD
jgi:hypothetical protein